MTEEKERADSAPPPAAGDAPYLAKRRLPMDEVRSVGAASLFAKGAIGVYLVAGLVCFGIAAYMAFGEQRPPLSVAVIAPAVGGIWFFVRLFMTASNRGLKNTP